MRYDKTKSILQDQAIDQQIEAGHTYVDLELALPFAKDEEQANEIRATLKTLFDASPYIQQVFLRHPDPLSFLANCRSGNRDSDLVQPQGLSCSGQHGNHRLGGEIGRGLTYVRDTLPEVRRNVPGYEYQNWEVFSVSAQ